MHKAEPYATGFYRLFLITSKPALHWMGDNSRMSVVLIVEDSENSAAMLEIAFLGIPGLHVLMAPSAVEAWRILHGDAGAVGAIVTDLNMPRMDGYELIRRVRADQRLSGVPIIVVSADTDPATPQRIAALGVEAFFPKPFSPAVVRRKLEQILDGRTH
jgi:CheY-like chemotaxis protein